MGFDFPIRVQTSTLNAWLLHKVEPIYHTSVLMGLMKNRGRSENDFDGGKQVGWNMRYLRREPRDVNGPVMQTSFPVTSTKVQAALNMCGYDMGETIQKAEKLANKGTKVQIYKLVESIINELVDDFMNGYRLRLWQDGTITDTGLMGILSMFGGSSTAARGRYTNPGAYTPITCADAATEFWSCAPSQTYAGVDTTLGAKVNDYNNPNTDEAWPLGDYSEAYSYASPLMVDYNSSQFTPTSGSPYSWDFCWQQAFNALTTWMGALHDMPVDLVVWHADLERRAADSLIGSSRFIVSDSSETRSLGFKSLEYNGTETMSEWGCPANMGFALNFSKMSLKNWQKQLIMKEEDHDIQTSDDLYKLDCFSQMQFDSPAFFGALVPASTAGT